MVNSLAELIVWRRAVVAEEKPVAAPQPTSEVVQATEIVPQTWGEVFAPIDWSKIQAFLQANPAYCPAPENIVRAFSLTPLNTVRVVIVGQDPYHSVKNGVMAADGLAFSVVPGAAIQPSMRQIRQEIQNCYPSIQLSPNGDLSGWARQGVLLLNRTFTSRQGTPDDPDHQRIWEGVFPLVMKAVFQHNPRVVVVAWGSKAQAAMAPFASLFSTQATLDTPRLFKSPHPSPRAQGFIGNRHFLLINQHLAAQGQSEIDWSM